MNAQHLDSIEKALHQEYLSLVHRAEVTAQIFWEHREGMLEVRSKGAFPILGCRVIAKDNSLRINWFYWTFYKVGGSTKRSNNHIPRGKSNFQYSLKKLYAKALPNEYDAVEHCEKRFADIRKESEALRKVRQAFYYYKQCWYSGYFKEKESIVPALEMDSGSTIMEVLEPQSGFGESD